MGLGGDGDPPNDSMSRKRSQIHSSMSRPQLLCSSSTFCFSPSTAGRSLSVHHLPDTTPSSVTKTCRSLLRSLLSV
eukprot:scaffold2602_cov246-Pinguiococcus_pyrenoidosus.AAC.1